MQKCMFFCVQAALQSVRFNRKSPAAPRSRTISPRIRPVFRPQGMFRRGCTLVATTFKFAATELTRPKLRYHKTSCYLPLSARF